MLVDLARLDVEELARLRVESPLIRVAFFALQRARRSRTFGVELRALVDDLVAIGARPDAEDAFVAIIGYSLKVSKVTRREFESVLEETMGAHMATRVLGTAAQEYFDEGKEKGIAEGVAKGIAEGQAEMLCRLVERRFGSVPTEARERIDAASPVELRSWFDRALVANDLHEVFDEPV